MMPEYAWDEEKNKLLKKTRKVSFEQVFKAINTGDAITTITHPNHNKYPKQKILIVIIKKYTYGVPFVKDGNNIFFKTIYPSRKYHKAYYKEEK